jgi:hypothetical protein
MTVDEHLSTFEKIGFIKAREICPAADLSLMAAESHESELVLFVLLQSKIARRCRSGKIVKTVMSDPAAYCGLTVILAVKRFKLRRKLQKLGPELFSKQPVAVDRTEKISTKIIGMITVVCRNGGRVVMGVGLSNLAYLPG